MFSPTRPVTLLAEENRTSRRWRLFGSATGPQPAAVSDYTLGIARLQLTFTKRDKGRHELADAGVAPFEHHQRHAQITDTYVLGAPAPDILAEECKSVFRCR